MSDPVLAEVLTGLREVQKSITDLTAEVRAANTGPAAQLASLRSDVDDHETRIRTQESTARAALTREEFQDLEEQRRDESNRRDAKRLVWIGIVFAALQVIEGFVFYLFSSKG